VKAIRYCDNLSSCAQQTRSRFSCAHA